MQYFGCCVLLCLAAGSLAIPVIDELDLPKYLGRWYQVYASPIVYNTFEQNATCCTANYQVIDAETLEVYNTQNLIETGGPFDDINGTAKVTNETGKLLVNFPSVPGPDANYWIMQLGPAVWGPDELYAYSLVSEPNGIYLFVLARDVADFYANYDQQVLEFLAQEGFDGVLNRPVATEHDDRCVYTDPDN